MKRASCEAKVEEPKVEEPKASPGTLVVLRVHEIHDAVIGFSHLVRCLVWLLVI